ISAGHRFFVAADREGQLHSWGEGVNGQLGHGACHTSIPEPARITHSAHFVSVASGGAFSLALDDSGAAYAWGENFDRELG
ncbi:regulator of chromosome condensation 1/beta-lactamase-inhibitor protein II, partial [Ochromonadaceae sp. CCMP2298]